MKVFPIGDEADDSGTPSMSRGSSSFKGGRSDAQVLI